MAMSICGITPGRKLHSSSGKEGGGGEGGMSKELWQSVTWGFEIGVSPSLTSAGKDYNSL